MITPIRPEEIATSKKIQMPDAILESFNELIAQNFSGDMARVRQNEIVARIANKGYDRRQIFDNHWLDVEDIYREAGWEVMYDKPGYNDSYEAYFEFSVARK